MYPVIHLIFAGFLFLNMYSLAQDVQSEPHDNSQNQIEEEFVNSPVLGFKPQSDCPVDILYSRTVALPPGSKNMGRVELVAKYMDDREIDNFIPVCEEEKQMPPSATRKKTCIYEVRASEAGFITFDVEASSRLTFYVKSVTFAEGNVWTDE